MHCQPIRNSLVNIWLNNNQMCLLCGRQGEQPLALCLDCETELPWLAGGCDQCALPGPAGLCPACRLQPPPFSQVEAPLAYAFPVDALVARFKHQARWPLGRLLGALLSRHLQHRYSAGLPRPEVLLPVPLARKRLRQRGFNQAQMLAGWLAKALGLAVDNRQLLRPRETLAQQRLLLAERQYNLNGAFALAAPTQLRGRHVALVDDVMTSGATARVLASLLRDAGAARVDVYCLARTPKPA